MLTFLASLHAVAARRGDGLRPELANLLECGATALFTASGETQMLREQENKALVGRWFDGFWGNPWNPQIIDELAAPDMLLQYSLHATRRGRDDVRNFMMDFRAAFPDLKFWGAADLIAEGGLRRRSMGRWRHPYRPEVSRFSCGLAAGGIRSEDALHWDNRAPYPGWQDRRGSRPR